MTKRKRKPTRSTEKDPVPAEHRPSFGRHATLISVLVIAAIGLVFFRRIAFSGEILTGGDVLAGAAIFEDYARERLAAGRFPLWNPYVFSGMPFFESMTWNGIVYPTYWVKILLERLPGVEMPRLYYLVPHYLLAGVGMFFYLRSRRVGHAGAITGGVAFMLTPHLVGLACIGHGGKVLTSAYIPLILMAAQRLMETGSRRWLGGLALLGGLQFLARHVQVSYFTWLLVFVFALFYVVTSRKQGEPGRELATKTAMLIGAAVLAAAMAAVLLVPLEQYSALSTRAAAEGGMGFEQATMWSFHPKEILTFLVPSFYGLAEETYWGTMPFQQITHTVGYVVLCLAAIALVARRNRDVKFLALLLCLGLFLSFGRHIGPVYRLIYHGLPGFSRFRVPALFLLFPQFALIALAGHGASVLVGEIEQKRGRWTKWALVAGLVGVAVGAIVLLSRSGITQAATSALAAKHPELQPAFVRELATRAVRMAAGDAGMLIAFSVGIAAAIYAIGTRKLLAWVSAGLLVGLIVWEVTVIDLRFLRPERMQELSRYYPETPQISFVKRQADAFRVAPVGRDFASNAYMFHRIETVGGYHSAKLSLYSDLIEKVGIGNLKLLSMLNVKYVLAGEEIQHPALVQVAPGVYENKAALPRAFLVGHVIENASDADMLAGLSAVSGGLDPWNSAMILGELPGPVESSEGSSVELVRLEPEEIEVRAAVNRPCLLVFSEIYYPLGWKAFVDGTETRIYRTNYAFRSIYLGAGDHTVTMRYAPTSPRLGLILSLCAAAIVAALLAIPARLRAREKAR